MGNLNSHRTSAWMAMIFMKLLRLIMLLAFFPALQPSTHGQQEVCSLRTFWVENKPFTSSSWELVGTFRLVPDQNEQTKLFHHEESVTDISVGVELIHGLGKKEKPLIRLGLSFSGKPDDLFDEIDSSQAESIYDKFWRFLSVRKNIGKGKRTYTFSFSCERQFLWKR